MTKVRVMDTPKWSTAQALLSAHERLPRKAVFVVTVDDKGSWESTVGGSVSTSEMLMAAEILRRRAFKSMEGW